MADSMLLTPRPLTCACPYSDGLSSEAYEIVDGESILDGADNVLKDQSIRFTKKENQEKYPGVIRRIVYYAPELQQSFVYYTNNVG